MTDNTSYAIKKKLAFLQGMVIHRSFRLDKVDIPPLLTRNEKLITLDFIRAISTMARLMKSDEMINQAQTILDMSNRKKQDIYMLLCLLMAAGVREYEWKEAAMRVLIKHKKDKLVKESISEWWKGKSP